MNEVKCPNCNAVLPSQEIAEGWCESCGKKIPNYVREAASSQFPVPQTQARPPEPHPHAASSSSAGLCSLCGNGEDRQSCWLRVIRVSYWVIAASVQKSYVRCLCCRDCRARLASLKWFRRACLLGMFLVWPLGCLIYLPFGVKKNASSLETALAISILLGIFAISFSMPILIALGGKRRMRRILSKEASEQLRQLTGVRRWGLSNFEIVKDAKQDGPHLSM